MSDKKYINAGLFHAYNCNLLEEKRKQAREEFTKLLLDDEVVKNNRNLQEKYIELYDKYTDNFKEEEIWLKGLL